MLRDYCIPTDDWLPEAGIGELISLAALNARWQRRWPRCLPVGHELRCCARATWVRFHSLPGAKRYAEDDSEYAEILRRHHVLLGEMAGADEVLVVTIAWSGSRRPNASRGWPGYCRTPSTGSPCSRTRTTPDGNPGRTCM